MKVILAIGNNEIERKISTKEEIIIEDKGDNLYELKGCINYLDKVDFIIVNKALSESSDILFDIVVAAQKKNIKIVILTNDFESTKAKREINNLVALEVYSFINIDRFNEDNLLSVLENYPKEFDFRLIADPYIKIVEKEKVVEKEKIVRSQVVTCFSNDDNFASAKMSVMLAHMFSEITDLKVLLIDLNTFAPPLDHFLCVEPYLNVNVKYDIEKQTSLGAIANAIERGNLTSDIFEELVIKSKKLRFDFVSGLYDSIKDEKISIETYDKLIDTAAKVYDVVVINTNSYLRAEGTYSALMNANKIIGIANGNFTSIRNLLSAFRLITNVVLKDSIGVVVNNVGEYSLTTELLQKAIYDDNGYKVLGYIPCDNELVEKSLNNNERCYNLLTKDMQESYNEIMVNLGYQVKQKKKKFSFLSRG